VLIRERHGANNAKTTGDMPASESACVGTQVGP
jgi:hypothetical protein